ncbi:MAG: hypothetical protein JNJ58_02665 [Chitinophagaceae bacterium]|nr:hypothetical protein [Chitinophagaceae bacterium]
MILSKRIDISFGIEPVSIGGEWILPSSGSGSSGSVLMASGSALISHGSEFLSFVGEKILYGSALISHGRV